MNLQSCNCFKIQFFFVLENIKIHVEFYVLTTASTKLTAFLDVAPYSLVEVDRHLRGEYCLHHQGDEKGSALL
jgi:hypothetical protein